MTNADKSANDYWGLSTDFLWNLTNALYGNGSQSHIGIVPYVGVGLLHNRQAQTNPFALSYGVMAQYGVTSRLKLTMEFGGKTTFSGFDGLGNANSFGGDNILSLSAGLSFTFGQNGFRKMINAKPVLIDNARLRETLAELYDENGRLSRQTSNDARVVAELKKILEIEGLLSRYDNLFASQPGMEKTDDRHYPVNDYSGLNKLRARLNGYHLPERNSFIQVRMSIIRMKTSPVLLMTSSLPVPNQIPYRYPAMQSAVDWPEREYTIPLNPAKAWERRDLPSMTIFPYIFGEAMHRKSYFLLLQTRHI